MIAEQIFNGVTASVIGISDVAYQSRKQTLDEYLAHSGGLFDGNDYLAWLAAKEKKELPRLSEQAVSLGKAIVKHATSGAKKVSTEEAKRRMDICESCDMWVEQGVVKFFGKEIEVKRRCSACGCAMDVKATWATSHCIQGKW